MAALPALVATTAPGPTPALRRRLLMVGGAVGVAAVVSALLRLRAATPEPEAAVVARRLLRFSDLPDGGVAIDDAASGTRLGTAHGEQGFLRGALRGLARERRRRGLGAEAPLHLLAYADRRLTLADPATGERINLESFGPSNAAVFARWLAAPALENPR